MQEMVAEQEIVRLQNELTFVKAELAACREDAERYRWMERNWYRTYDVITKCFQPFTNRMGELADRARVAIDAVRKDKEGA